MPAGAGVTRDAAAAARGVSSERAIAPSAYGQGLPDLEAFSAEKE